MMPSQPSAHCKGLWEYRMDVSVTAGFTRMVSTRPRENNGAIMTLFVIEGYPMAVY